MPKERFVSYPDASTENDQALNLGRTDRHLSESDLHDWRPERKRGGRRKAAE